jgi:precorrin-6A/cobalt-precorrin-6A reductase
LSQPHLWLIGGTSDSVLIAQAIAAQQFPSVITVTTTEAKTLYAQVQDLPVRVGQLSPDEMLKFLEQYQIVGIIDVSHPFAQVISTQAIHLSQQLNLPYLRYERAEIETSPNPNILHLASFTDLLTGDYLQNHRVLLAVGAKSLTLFQPWQAQATLFARILPRLDSLQMALQAGFTGDRLLALRPPYDLALELALWQHWQISLVVTKASGEAGGEATKQQAAIQLGIPLIVIERPRLSYPQQTCSLEQVLQFCRACLSAKTT